MHKYLAQFAFGNSDPESLAKVLIYPRVLGTSITTTFRNQMQVYCGSVLSGHGSLVNGMDIEFIDCLDGKKKFCQVKAGPQTITKDDVATMVGHFQAAIRLSRTNNQIICQKPGTFHSYSWEVPSTGLKEYKIASVLSRINEICSLSEK